MKVLSEYYDGLIEQIKSVESERDRQTSALRSQIDAIESAYTVKLQGLRKAIEGVSEAMGTAPTRSPLEVALAALTPPTRYPRTQDVLRAILKEEATKNGPGMTLEQLAEEALRRGARIESQNPPQAVRSSIYAMKEKGEPVALVAPGTWSWGFTNDEDTNEVQTVAAV